MLELCVLLILFLFKRAVEVKDEMLSIFFNGVHCRLIPDLRSHHTWHIESVPILFEVFVKSHQVCRIWHVCLGNEVLEFRKVIFHHFLLLLIHLLQHLVRHVCSRIQFLWIYNDKELNLVD